MSIEGSMPIVKIAGEVPGAIAVFESLGVDYACAGDRSLDDAIYAAGLVPELVIATLRDLDRSGKRLPSWNERPLDELTRHLVQHHHRFMRDELARVALRLADACSSRAGVSSEMLTLRAAFTRLSDLILPHVHREEEYVFPAIEALETNTEELVATLRELALEHGAIAAQLARLRELRLRLAESGEPPHPYRAIIDGLAAIEAHLHEYMFLENCILFPRATALAEELAAPALR